MDSDAADKNDHAKFVPDLDRIVDLIFQALPYVRQQHPSDHSYRGLMVAATQFIETAYEEGAHYLARKNKPVIQKTAELKHYFASHWEKTMTDPEDPLDRSTALGYLLAVHRIDKPKTAEKLREALVANGIPINPNTIVMIDIRTQETVNLGDTVRVDDLDRYAHSIQEKEAQRQRDYYERRKSDK